MRRVLFLFILVWQSCTDKTPEPQCSHSGDFIMSLQNEKGRVMLDSVSNQYYLLFTVGGGMAFNSQAVSCNLPSGYQVNGNVLFDGDFFEYQGDSLGTKGLPLYSVSITEIEHN